MTGKLVAFEQQEVQLVFTNYLKKFLQSSTGRYVRSFPVSGGDQLVFWGNKEEDTLELDDGFSRTGGNQLC